MTAAVDGVGLGAALAEPGIVLVDFWAEWCAPCHAMQPILDELALEHGAMVSVVSVDVARHADVAAQLDVQSLPTLIYFVDGAPAVRLVGSRTKRQLARELALLTAEPQ